MNRASRAFVCLLVSAATFLLAAGAAEAKTWHVHPGQSIQAAIDQAKPGDTIVVDAGVYSENLTITKDGLKLRGAGIGETILQPGVVHASPCVDPNDPSSVNGICVLGHVDFATNTLGAPVKGTKIEGFSIHGFPGFGVFLFDAAESSVTDTEAFDNAGYGISGFHLSGIRFEHDSAHGNGEPGFYVGDSPHANAHVVHNVSYGNGRGGEDGAGILIRDSSHGEVRDNTVYDNCAGIVFVDSGENPDPLQHWEGANNSSEHNNAVCAGEPGGAPPFAGLGIGLLGGQHVHLHDNTVLGNVGGSFPFSGGITVVNTTGIGGSAPQHDHVDHNTAHGNAPFDVFWDGSGSKNTFKHNDCTTSVPPWICA
jgi:parallel beta-helix repeat protein